MRTTQEILTLATETGYYGYSGGAFMCDSLAAMEEEDLISPLECNCVQEEVKQFIQGEYTFRGFLFSISGLWMKDVDTREIRQAIYDNWEERNQLLDEWLELIQIYREFSESTAIPIMEVHPDVTVTVAITPTEVKFDFDAQGLPVWTDGEFVGGVEGYCAPLTDFMGWTLQQVLEHIHANVMEGFIIPNNLQEELL